MQCVRCGASFEGRFCPRCGAPSAVPSPPAPRGWPCPRCGTLFLGNFCPRCGLPAAWSYRPVARPSGGRSVLTILWTLAMIGFIAFAVSDFAGLAWSPTLVVPGVQHIGSGATVNSALDFYGNWTPDSWGTGTNLSYQPTGGHDGGFLRMTLFSSGARGFWMQPFRVDGSVPFTAAVRLDVMITGGLVRGQLLVSVDGSASVPDPATSIGNVNYTGSTPWTTTDRFRADARLADPGVYYLKIAFVGESVSSPVDVGFDNIRLTWTTDAAVFLYLPAPGPAVVFVSQDKNLFLAYYGLIVAAIVLAAGYHTVREVNDVRKAFTAPLEAIGRRLRSRSGWIAVGQVWMAMTFFQVVFILLYDLIVSLFGGSPAASPINIDNRNAWVFLFELANASVYEEVAYRILLIGVPMTIGSLIVRVMEVNRGGTWNGSGPAGRHIVGAWRYLFGGVVRRDSPKETLAAAWVFLFASATIFGFAHGPGWGWWKIIPAAIGGLGFGYLFLRHGVGAAILGHFVNDYALSLSYEGVGGIALETVLSLLFIGLAIAGAGFFAWYVLHAWRSFWALIARFRPSTRAPAPPRPSIAYAPSSAYAPPDLRAAPTPPPQFSPGSMPEAWPPPPSPAATPAVFREMGRIPPDYRPAYVPPPYGYPPVRFQCPQCGWVEARYDAGLFTCTRCGRAS